MLKNHDLHRRVLGPYSERGGKVWRVVLQAGRGREATKKSAAFPTEAEATAFAVKARALMPLTGRTVGAAIEDFLAFCAASGAKTSTLTTYRFRLAGLLKPAASLPLRELTPERCLELYTAYSRRVAPDTHHGALAVASSMGAWAKKSSLLTINPWAEIDRVGRKRRGKPQLRIDEARKLTAWLVEHVDDDRALGVLMPILLGLRAHEVVGIEKRDLDDRGQLLHVAKSKTAAGVRPVELPGVLRQPLIRRAQMTQDRLLPYSRYWVRNSTRWACELAGVPVVCAQSLRGLFATLALESGVAPHAVARTLGHTTISMTKAAYAAGGSGESHRAAVVADRLGLASKLPTSSLQDRVRRRRYRLRRPRGPH
jgi:integrase